MDLKDITNYEVKLKIAKKILDNVKDGQVIGFGSGTTSYIAASEICKKVNEEKIHIVAIPTSKEIEELCKENNVEVGNLIENDIDWAFDGADEVDENKRLIKGKGAAMFKEKLNIVSSPITYILVDNTKIVKNLGENNPVPVEVFPSAMKYVSNELKKIGAVETVFRGMTENNNAILDTKFDVINNDLELKIKQIPGVIESGLFLNYKVEIVKE